jgi:hypothetical protein
MRRGTQPLAPWNPPQLTENCKASQNFSSFLEFFRTRNHAIKETTRAEYKARRPGNNKPRSRRNDMGLRYRIHLIFETTLAANTERTPSSKLCVPANRNQLENDGKENNINKVARIVKNLKICAVNLLFLCKYSIPKSGIAQLAQCKLSILHNLHNVKSQFLREFESLAQNNRCTQRFLCKAVIVQE